MTMIVKKLSNFLLVLCLKSMIARCATLLTMTKMAASAGLYLRFLNLVRALDNVPKFPVLDATEERLLSQLALAWETGKSVTVLQTMSMESGVSPTTIHRRLKSLKKKGVIELAMDESDNRIKYVLPTQLSIDYFTTLSDCLASAAKAD